MCNLSQGIKEDGIAIGQTKAETRIIINMYNNGFTVEQIASATDKDVDEITAVIEKKKLELV